MIHIVFNQVEVELMQQVIALDETLQGPVVQIRDDFAVGPLAGLDTEEGWQARVEWWRELLKGSPYPDELAGSFDDRKTVAALKAQLTADPEEVIWIWMGQNQHDVSGYYWLIPQLKEFQGRILVLYMNNLPFINDKGQIFYPSWLSEIRPSEFLKARKLARPVTLSEFEIDPDEWNKLVQENALVRILEGGKKIAGRDTSFYDEEILKNLTGEWQKATRVLSNTLNRMKIKTGDVFIMWRMKELIAAGKITTEGETDKDWKSFDVRLAGKKEIAEGPITDAGS
ncbi:DUF1835 domain-containing protein [Niabella sp. CC-SYL272]|uniref:DUF1835 domain-containing protein n=1 Tax=Niabella agricola TaxID=2891571 RepID=UPI001F32DCC2|nr:DUF1835 domain-containing protein [Niabella agricola]MCF3107417.1 DUF1835 domain-containing protein [Niabella agricola]